MKVPTVVVRTASAPDGEARRSPQVNIRPSYKVIVVLPVFNEEANIGCLLDRIDEHLTDSFVPYQVVAVDDGSSDGTAEILQQYSRNYPLEIYRHTVNQ